MCSMCYKGLLRFNFLFDFAHPIRYRTIKLKKDKTQERLPEGIGNAYRQRSA